MKVQGHWVAIVCAVALAACNQQPAATTQAPAAAPAADHAEREPRPIPANCPVLAQRKWKAEIGTSGSAHTLTVEGEVDLPAAGYSVSLARTPAAQEDEAATTLTLNVTPPAAPGAQVVTPTAVRYFGPADHAFRRVRIACGDGTLHGIRVKGHD